MRKARHLLLIVALACAPMLLAAEPMRIVTTFTILSDFTEQVAGDRAEVISLVGPDGDSHGYEPTPADVREISRADLVIVNGLNFEGWIDRLIAASGYTGEVVVATRTVNAIETGEDDHGHGHDDDHGHGHDDDHGHGHDDDHGHGHDDDHGHGHDDDHGHGHDDDHGHGHDDDHGHGHDDDHGHGHDDHGHYHGPEDPHAWSSPVSAKQYVQVIRDALIEKDPENAAHYSSRADAYLAELDELDQWVRDMLAPIPEEHRRAIVGHDSFAYFGRDYGVEFFSALGLSTDAEPSASQIGRLIRHLREDNVRVLFLENITDTRMVDRIAADGDGYIGGSLYSDALSQPDGPAPDYISMIRFNVEKMRRAFEEAYSD